MLTFPLLRWLILILAGFIIYEALRMLFLGIVAKRLGKKARPYSADGPGKSVIIFGDSAAAGAGAEHPSLSLAGRLGAEFPRISIRNHAVIGSGTRELAVFLRDHPPMRADLVIIQIGGIDTLTLRPLTHLPRRLEYIFNAAKTISAGSVIVLTSANLGTIPFFRFPLSRYFERRTRKIRDIFLQMSEKTDVVYVDLFEEAGSDPSNSSPRLLFAADHIHPNGVGYGIWYAKLQKALEKHHFKEMLKHTT